VATVRTWTGSSAGSSSGSSSCPIEHRFHLDTGSGAALILHTPFVREHKLLGPQSNTIRTIGLRGAGGESLGRAVVPRRLV
jgi:hypothetical protein